MVFLGADGVPGMKGSKGTVSLTHHTIGLSKYQKLKIKMFLLYRKRRTQCTDGKRLSMFL